MTLPVPETVRMLQECLPLERLTEHSFRQKVREDPNVDAEGLLWEGRPGNVLGFCLAVARRVPIEGHFPDADRGYVTLFAVRADARRQGVASRLLERAEQRFRETGRSSVWVSPYAPGYFTPGVDVDAYPDALRLLERRGYLVASHAIAMEATLEDLAVPPWIAAKEAKAEVSFAKLGPETVAPCIDFVAQTFPGDWVRIVRECGQGQGGAGRQIHVAVEDGRVVGFSHHDGERFGPIGTDPAVRGRGIGHALMFRTLISQRESGARRSWFMWSDQRTADRLYHAAGFQVTRRFAILRKDLDPPPDNVGPAIRRG